MERLVERIQRTVPSLPLRVDVHSASPQTQGFCIEAQGKGGTLRIESGPLQTVLVAFGGARFSFFLLPDVDTAFEQVAERVRSIAAGEIVVFEEQVTPSLKRTTVFGVEGGELVRVVDTGLEPGTVSHGPNISSFTDAFNRPPGAQERRRMHRLAGGLLGRLKRKIAEKILERAATAVMGAFKQATATERSKEAPQESDGRRTLPGKRR